MKIPNFKSMLAEIEKDRGIKEINLLGAIKDAMVSAYKKRYPESQNITADITDEGETRLYENKTVVEEVLDPISEISLDDARKVKEDIEIGGIISTEVTPKDFGRLAAQTAKQVIIQRIREAEKDEIYDEFSSKVGSLIYASVQNKEHGGYLINLGRIETFLTFSEAIPSENLRPKDKIKVLILEVKRTPKGPQVLISRAHPDLVRRLFEAEVPEITQGILEIKAIAREAGRRTKVAVSSKDPNVGAVGTCVGPMGARIQNITKELGAERVDIIEWSEDPVKFIANSLSPAKVSKVEVYKEIRTAKVILPEK